MKSSKSNINSPSLNEAQALAVNALEGPVLVVAGAGTGKTRVIEYRVFNLINHGVDPKSILLLTFTRKSAREMIDRASRHDAKCKDVDGGTFHSFAYRIIQRYHKKLGFADNFSFIDEQDAEEAISLLSERLGFKNKEKRFPKKDTLRTIISMSFNRTEKISDILDRDYSQFLEFYSEIENLRDEYVKYKIARNLIDYDDMLLYLKVLLEDSEIREKLNRRYKYIMVDEFQDTNKIQGEIIYLLGKENKNILAVGDDTQSIYSFRGAYYKNMFDFPKRFPKTKIIKLERNYRSTQPILDLANSIIEEEKEKYTKVLKSVRGGSILPKMLFFKDMYREASFVASEIKNIYDERGDQNRTGVLYRSNHLSLPLQVELAKLNIPFVVYGGIRFVDTAHVKDTLAFLRVIQNVKDELSWHRVLKLFTGIGGVTAGKISAKLINDIDSDISNFKTKKFYKYILWFIGFVKKADAQKETVSAMLSDVVDFYSQFVREKFDDYPKRTDDLKILIQISAGYKCLSDFLADFVALDSPQRSIADITSRTKDEAGVVLSTVHSAKGLEWNNVFIIALSDGSLPVSYVLEDDEGLEEECRLLYVAITRAKTNLYLTMHNESRNNGMYAFNKLCRFLNIKSVLKKIDVNHNFEEEDSFDYNQDRQSSNPFYTKSSLYRKIKDNFFEEEYI